jgi:hypothetical protein
VPSLDTVARQALHDQIEAVGASLGGLARKRFERFLAAVKRADYDPRKVRKLVKQSWLAAERDMALALAEETKDAAELAERVERHRAVGARYYQRDAKGARDLARQVESMGPTPTDAAVQRRVHAPLGERRDRADRGARVQRTEASYELRARQPPLREYRLSERLHRSAVNGYREADAAIGRALREGRKTMDLAKDLITDVRRAGHGEIGGNVRIPKRLQQLQAAGRAAMTGDPTAQKVWRRQMASLDKSIGKMADVRGGYRELHQILQKSGPKAMDRALQRWTQEKQITYAHRIAETELQAAYRLRQVKQWEREGHIRYLVWRLNKGARKGYVKRTPLPKHAKGGRRGRCICEDMAGKRFTLEDASDYPRMGHPHCRCYWEPIGPTGKPVGEWISAEDAEDVLEKYGI